jgi:sulfide dehydrogenase [flavocytochrome c] flavoprotein chain
MDRRSFFSLLAAGTAGQAFTARAVNAQSAPAKKFVVVGGGMAGASCAKYLAMWGARSGVAVSVTLVDTNPAYVSCIMSNKVVTGERSLASLTFGYDTLASKFGVTFVNASVTSVDATGKSITLSTGGTLSYDRLVIAPGIQFDYSTVSITATGLTDAEALAQIPHAWKAGPQTEALRNQLVNLAPGSHVVVTVPKSPYRCPPGPYERVCVIADWLRKNKPGSRVIVLDANASIQAEKVNFGNAFTNVHNNIDYFPNATLTGVTFDGAAPGVKTVSLAAPVTLTNPVTNVAGTTTLTEVVAGVVNYLPPQKAGALVIDTLGPVEGGLVGGRWAKINELSYETLLPGVHVVGDSIASKQPKAGHISNQQGKVCADAILRLETGLSPYPAPVTNSACYTPITSNSATWLTAVFAYNATAGEMQVSPPGVIESPDGPSKDSYEEMGKWFSELMKDTFA